jgi:anti-anti-sigma regulatory factor
MMEANETSAVTRSVAGRSTGGAPSSRDYFSVALTEEHGEVTAALSGRLTAASLVGSIDSLLQPIEKHRPREVIIEGSAVTYCDGAGIGLIGEVRRVALLSGGVVRFDGFSNDLQTLIDLSALPDPSAPQLRAPAKPGLITQVGIAAADVLDDLRGDGSVPRRASCGSGLVDR